jgi:hypothetical protein
MVLVVYILTITWQRLFRNKSDHNDGSLVQKLRQKVLFCIYSNHLFFFFVKRFLSLADVSKVCAKYVDKLFLRINFNASVRKMLLVEMLKSQLLLYINAYVRTDATFDF